MTDSLLRERERAFAAAPEDPNALAAVRLARRRAGRCPECRSPDTQPSSLSLDDVPTCWSCYFKIGLERLRLLVRARSAELLNAPEDLIDWGTTDYGATEEADAPGRMITLRAVAFAIRRALDGHFPAVCYPASSQNALNSRTRRIPVSVFAPASHPRRCGLWRQSLYPAAVAFRLRQTIVVGFYLGFYGVDDEELGKTWKILEKKQEMHGNAYVVAHGRPVWQKNLRQRMAEWAEGPSRLEGPLTDFRMVAPTDVWRAWREERLLQAKARREAARASEAR